MTAENFIIALKGKYSKRDGWAKIIQALQKDKKLLKQFFQTISPILESSKLMI